jgi:flagellar motility protein MotE (MotC chaperone)
MNLKIVVAVLLIAAAPVSALAQSPSTAKVNKGDAQKVVTIISGDKAKTQTYCEMQKLASQVDDASAKQDNKTVLELSEKIATLEKTLGPEYAALFEGLEDITKDDQLGAEFDSATEALDKLCPK